MLGIKDFRPLAKPPSKSSDELQSSIAPGQIHRRFPITFLSSSSNAFVTAREPIATGDLIWAELPLVTQDSSPTHSSVKAAVAILDPQAQEIFLALPVPPELSISVTSTTTDATSEPERELKTSPSLSSFLPDLSFGGESGEWGWKKRGGKEVKIAEGVLGVFDANAFPLGGDSYPLPLNSKSGVGLGVFPILSRFAHSCQPSATFHRESLSSQISVYALSPISKSTTPTISLVDPFLPAAERRALLRTRFGTECQCAACTWEPREMELGDARRRRIRVIFKEIPGYAAEVAVRSVEEEGLGAPKGCFAYDAYQYCVTSSDFASAKMWI